MLAINEEFESFQGEGKNTGIRQYFVRLQGCGVGCYFCDTKYTWRGGMAEVDEYDVVRRAAQSKAQWICITGGEPLEQDIKGLVEVAHDNGFKVQIETSGMLMQEIVKKIDHVCVSPKQLYAKKIYTENTEILKYAHEVKCVITKEEDIEYYVKHYAEYDGLKVFQPVDNKPEFAEMILKKEGKNILKWKLQIQQHKILNLR